MTETKAIVVKRYAENLEDESIEYLGVPRATIIEAKQITQLFFAENEGRFGQLVARRLITRAGVTVEDTWDPPREIGKLPRPKFPAVQGIVEHHKRRDPNDPRRSRRARLAKRRKAATEH